MSDSTIITTGAARRAEYHRLAAAHYRGLADAYRLGLEAIKISTEITDAMRASMVQSMDQRIADVLASAYDHDAQRERALAEIGQGPGTAC